MFQTLHVCGMRLTANMIEMALCIALIAFIALPATDRVAIGMKRRICQYAHQEANPDQLIGVFDEETGTCNRDPLDPASGNYFN